MAENLEKERVFDSAINYYRKAADYYSMDKSPSQNSQHLCLTKMCDLMCITDHQDAFEESKRVLHKYNNHVDL
jgi:hypothetical protein